MNGARSTIKEPLKITIVDSSGHEAEVDLLNYLVSIDVLHHKVHDGEVFIVSDVDTDVDTASPKYWHIKTPAGIKFHMRINLETDTGGLVEFFEDPTTTADGTALVAYNADRNSSKTTTVEFYYDPTVSNDGTRIQVARIGAGRDKKLGGIARAQVEWILKENEQYLIKITPDSNDAEVTMNLEGYEVT